LHAFSKRGRQQARLGRFTKIKNKNKNNKKLGPPPTNGRPLRIWSRTNDSSLHL